MKAINGIIKSNLAGGSFGWMVKILVPVLILIAILAVKENYINTGYKISNLSNTLNDRQISYQQLLEKRNKMINGIALYKKARKMGFRFPEYKKVYYVE